METRLAKAGVVKQSNDGRIFIYSIEELQVPVLLEMVDIFDECWRTNSGTTNSQYSFSQVDSLTAQVISRTTLILRTVF